MKYVTEFLISIFGGDVTSILVLGQRFFSVK
jgi:hypothetical protein